MDLYSSPSTTVGVVVNSSGWVAGPSGIQWFVHRGTRRREGVARTVAGAKSAVTQVRRRMSA